MTDKYEIKQDPYCYLGTSVLKNLLHIQEHQALEAAERDFSDLAAESLEFNEPPYDFQYLKKVHNTLFADVYAWAGEVRRVDISKGDTRFCTMQRIEPEAQKLFSRFQKECYFTHLDKPSLIKKCAELYTELNVACDCQLWL